jgi:glutamyl-tRNA synthetase
MNGQWLRMLDIDTLYSRALGFWPESANAADESRKKEILTVVKDRLKTLTDIPVMTGYFFETPNLDWTMAKENKFLSEIPENDIKNLLTAAYSALENIEFTDDNLESALNKLLESTGQKPAVLFSLIRIVVSWAPFSPALNQTLRVIGKDESLKRIQSAIQSL